MGAGWGVRKGRVVAGGATNSATGAKPQVASASVASTPAAQKLQVAAARSDDGDDKENAGAQMSSPNKTLPLALAAEVEAEKVVQKQSLLAAGVEAEKVIQKQSQLGPGLASSEAREAGGEKAAANGSQPAGEEKVWCCGVQTVKKDGKFWWAQENAGGTGDHFNSWSEDRVAEWVQTVQAGRFHAYAEKFRAAGIAGAAFSAITQQQLKELGIQDPKTRGILLAAISAEASFGAQAEIAVAVKPSEEMARRALQKQREAAEASPDEEEAQDPADAAALVLRTILGETGTPELFTAKIVAWRTDHPPVDYTAAAPPAGKSATRRVASSILVAARVRPVLKDVDSSALEAGDFESVTVPADASEGIVVHSCGMRIDGKTPRVEHKSFRVHQALGSSCGEKRAFEMMAPLVDAAVKHSTHSTSLCYGQTGSGKTHTVRSLAEHTAQHLFASLEAKLVVLEAFELKGGSRGMMLTSTGHAFSLNEDSKPELTLFEGADGVVHVGGSEGATAGGQGDLNLKHCVLAAGAEELVARFKEAEQRRTCLDTKRNKASSRSHAFYRFHLAQKNAKGSITGTGACIELVDLAGSESNKDSLFHDRLRVEDTARINNSLMALNDCIRKQTQGASYVPFRADKLTQLLRPCFVKKPRWQLVVGYLWRVVLVLSIG
ncbi:unnamed protein product [Polarella glacialis]|uniref:Kinesin-like protein n=1 Tax=Polarella glacialis TaxID=89957 RepID=A0A813KC86_POLGL|nr:unnamed protein product [Polarella glacialis]CAE8698088.1 unnamed protein product [Polarella glacialis]